MSQADLEKQPLESNPLDPITLKWSHLSFEVDGKKILDDVSGELSSGQILAVMGPSGAGKSTFLDVLCKRSRKTGTTGSVSLNGSADFDVERAFSFVEQDDALLGVLTVRETISYAARLSLTPNSTNIPQRVDFTLRSLGLQNVSSNKIGHPLLRGVSGGQKRRVTIGCSVVARPRVLVLDEPTSGLDSNSAWEVMNSIKQLAKATNMICIASIHQPNFEVFSLFDNLLLLAEGKTMYHGQTSQLHSYLSDIGHPCPTYTNPADQAMTIVNTDFDTLTEKPFSSQGQGSDSPSSATGEQRLDTLSKKWKLFQGKYGITPSEATQTGTGKMEHILPKVSRGDAFRKTFILTERNFLNYARNILAFGIRMGMYVGMGLMLATIWIHLGTSTDKINDRLSVFFFSVAFLGFMSVAGIPAFLEERAVFVRERSNGLYTPLPYILANTLSILPFLFACTLLFSLISYWAIGLHPGGTAFFRFTAYLFLGVLAAETQSVLIAAIVPIFVASLALASFLNGFWMCVQGYFIKATSLPRFWYYWAHWIDFQTFAFQLLVRNDVKGLIFQCPTTNGSCLCPFESSLTPAQCALSGDDIVQNLGYQGANDGLYVGILLIIIVFYRVLTWAVLVIRKK